MKKIALISPNKDAISETFIKAHKNRLNGKIHYLYGGRIPQYMEDGTPLVYSIPHPLGDKLKRLLPAMVYDKLQKKPIYTPENGIYHYLKTHKIDLVFAEYGLTGAELTPICKELNIPLIVHFHGFDASVYHILQQYKDKYQRMFEYASAVIGVSNAMVNQLQKLGAKKDTLYLNPYGPNPDFLKILPNYQSNILVAIGRFVDKKAPYFTILAFQKLQQKYPEAKLVMGGEGVLLSTCQNIAKSLNLNIEFKGVISHHEVKELYQSSFCFVQHSIVAETGDSEGTPVAVLEAQASGLPVVSTFHAGIPDVVKHKKTGFLVDEKDVDKMADYMIKLYENRELAKQFGQSAKIRIQENFTMEKHIEGLNQIILKIK